MLKIRKIDVLDVYPKKARLYFGKKWALIAYELQCGKNEIKGFLDFPLPKECDDIHPVARAALDKAIERGAFEAYTSQPYVNAAAA